MGQQQLLLLVLGIVIVGLAVVVGIEAFSENRKKANVDALVSDLVRFASDAQAWMLKPAAFGGGANSCATNCDWRMVTFSALGYTAVEGVHSNVNGRFALLPQSNLLYLFALSEDNGNLVGTLVAGTTPDLIATGIATDLSPFQQETQVAQ